MSPIPFDTVNARIISGPDTIRLRVEVAVSDQQHQFGLMDRPSLAAGSGMLFLYSEVQDSASGFWMFRTRMPLDIAFVDSTGRIASIVPMSPCESPNPNWCESYTAGVRYESALEVNSGFFDANGIRTGDTLEYGGDGGREPGL